MSKCPPIPTGGAIFGMKTGADPCAIKYLTRVVQFLHDMQIIQFIHSFLSRRRRRLHSSFLIAIFVLLSKWKKYFHLLLLLGVQEASQTSRLQKTRCFVRRMLSSRQTPQLPPIRMDRRFGIRSDSASSSVVEVLGALPAPSRTDLTRQSNWKSTSSLVCWQIRSVSIIVDGLLKTIPTMPNGGSLQSFRSRLSMKRAMAPSRHRLRSLRSTWTLFIHVSSVHFSFATTTTHRRLIPMSMLMAETLIVVMLAALLLMLEVFALVLFVLSVSLLEWFHQASECTLPVQVLEKRKRKLCCRILQTLPTRTRNKKLRQCRRMKKLLLSVAIPWPFLSRRQKEECPGRATLCLPIF
jgi:hypothetical protein